MKNTIFIINFFIISLFLSCDETVETPTPTPAPAKHVNKLTCKINGELWEALPKKASGILSNPDLRAYIFINPKYPLDTGLFINAYNREKQENMSLGFPFLDKQINQKNYDSGPFSGPGLTCRLDTLKMNKVTILSHDRIKNIVKGNFEFTCYGIGTNKDTIRVKEGFFDLQYSH